MCHHAPGLLAPTLPFYVAASVVVSSDSLLWRVGLLRHCVSGRRRGQGMVVSIGLCTRPDRTQSACHPVQGCQGLSVGIGLHMFLHSALLWHSAAAYRGCGKVSTGISGPHRCCSNSGWGAKGPKAILLLLQVGVQVRYSRGAAPLHTLGERGIRHRLCVLDLIGVRPRPRVHVS